MKMDVVALGELLIDFTSSGLSEQNNPLFEANPGGAPGNVLAMLAKLGKKTAFIGKVGEDMFGHMLVDTVAGAGIETKGILVDKMVNTTLAFVKTAPDGDRDFSFFRKPGADTMLKKEEVDAQIIKNGRVFHFGTLSLTGEPVKSATQHAVQLAKEAGVCISFDPNLRPPLWADLEEARRQMEWGCTKCDILKIADEELLFLTGCSTLAEGSAKLRRQYPNIWMLLITKGKHGAECQLGDVRVECPTFLDVVTVDTTGAGDTFLGCCLAYLLEKEMKIEQEAEIKEMLVFANAAASLVTTRKGAIRAMPSREETLALINKSK